MCLLYACGGTVDARTPRPQSGLRCRIVNPCWPGCRRTMSSGSSGSTCLRAASAVTPLDGGITNRNYRISTPYGDFVVRLSDPESSVLAIDRDNEYLNSLAAAKSGVRRRRSSSTSPALACSSCTGSGGGRSLTTDVREPRRTCRASPRPAACCTPARPFASDFDMFDIQRALPGARARAGLPAARRVMRSSRRRWQRLRAAMAAAARADRAVQQRPAGRPTSSTTATDSGSSTTSTPATTRPSFELGNIWSESTLADDLLEPFVTAYWGSASPAQVARARLWALMSQVRLDAVGVHPGRRSAPSTSTTGRGAWRSTSVRSRTFDGPDFDDWLDSDRPPANVRMWRGQAPRVSHFGKAHCASTLRLLVSACRGTRRGSGRDRAMRRTWWQTRSR